MYKSVKDNGGFYIARFEAGIEGTTTSTITNDSNKQIQDGTVKPVSKQGVGVWNFITWGGIGTDKAVDGLAGNENENGAVKVARGMYQNNTETAVKSTLCYGVQWDASLQFIDPDYTGFAKDSTGKGNYTQTIAITGDKEEYSHKNIYDMAGNLWEYTMEGNDKQRIQRGGYYATGRRKIYSIL